MFVLGINCAYHESAACLIGEGGIIGAVEEERFTRIKHAKEARLDNPDQLPWNAIEYLLGAGKIRLGDVDLIGFSLCPETRLRNIAIDPVVDPGGWGTKEGESEFYRRILTVPDRLQERGFQGKFQWYDHHLCHLASAYYASGFPDAGILSLDGIGEISTTVTALGKQCSLNVLNSIMYPNSIGFLWERMSEFLGFTAYDAGTVMSLAANGNPKQFRTKFETLVTQTNGGGFKVDNNLLRFRVSEFSKLEDHFQVKRRNGESELESVHCNIAAALQEATNETMVHLTKHLLEISQSKNLCFAGGVALNCVGNYHICERSGFDNVFIQPAANDAGTALGAAYIAWFAQNSNTVPLPMTTVYLGPHPTNSQIRDALICEQLDFEELENIEEVAAQLLSQGNVVGWFQGAMEFGPRALGNRSLLADPRTAETVQWLNQLIKHREPFRPFASSVLRDHVQDWFHIGLHTPAAGYMLVAYPARQKTKLMAPAIVHTDHTCRIQTVSREANPRYYRLLSEFHKITGVPILLNTSFNDREPIVCSPQDAIDTFKKSKIDVLILNKYLVRHAKS